MVDVTQDLVWVANVEAERVRWLWPGRIPLGKVTVLDGDPGVGKSTLTLTVAAKVTTGSPFPDGSRPPEGRVLLLSAEDEIGDTIRPRLEVAGADLEMVAVLPDVREEDKPPRPPEIPLDLARIEAMVAETGTLLVVVDPLMAFLSGAIDSHRDQDVRRALAAMTAMAARTGAAVVVVRHLNKVGGSSPLYRGGGSIGIIGAARAGLLVAPDPDDEGRRVLAVSKSNLARVPEALAYRLVSDERYDTARLVWDGATGHTAADLLRPPLVDEDAPERSRAEEALRAILANGPVRFRDLAEEAREVYGVSERTLRRAKETLGIVVDRIGEPGRRGGGAWWWALPQPEDGGHLNGGGHLNPEDVSPAQGGSAEAELVKAAKVSNNGDGGHLNPTLLGEPEPDEPLGGAP